VIEYRCFRNSDPPDVLSLWNDSQLGRAAADGVSSDAFEVFVFSQPYFDRKGFILAHEGERLVGFAHAGFGSTADGSSLSHEVGVICAVVVHPEFRRQGVGRELASRAERYLEEAGSREIFAGCSPGRDPFFNGLYGGGSATGFLESDEFASPFLQAIGHEPFQRHAVFQRATDSSRDPMDFRLVLVRRKTQLACGSLPDDVSWWWITTLGRLDSARFRLVPKQGGESTAAVTVVGLDIFTPKWGLQAFGLCNLVVSGGRDAARVLVLDTCKRLAEERFTLVEAYALESDTESIAVWEATGFQRVDTGVVYRRKSE
jgi:GNAT superfamily N-acetyltransferase